jgi:CubicO group peptidase (beta-lactamase class C family)
MMHRLVMSLLAVSLLLAPGASAQPREWQASTPEEQGMSSEALARLVDFGLFNSMDSLLVARRGRIVLEATYAPFREGLKHRINSATKAVVATLIAIAQRDGLLDSTERRVLDFFPGRTIAVLDERKQAMTIQDLLDMRSGIDWGEPFGGIPWSVIAMEQSPDWQQFVLDRPMAVEPGTTYLYSSGNSHLLSAILTKLTGRSALDYAREKLFGPLGIEDVQWRHDPQGVSTGGYGLYLHPRDMAKIGQLWLRNGVWEKKQILPASWVARVRAADIAMRESWAANLRYGNQFWTVPGRDAYMAVGYNRQLIVVMPKLDIVVATTGAARFPPLGGTPSRPSYRFETLLEYVANAVKSEMPLPPDEAATAQLAERVKEANRDTPGLVGGSSEMAKTISGKTWRFAANELNMKSLTLRLDGPQPSYEYELTRTPPGIAAGPFGGPIGFDGHFRVGGRRPYGPSAARGAWTADGKSLVVEAQTLGDDDAVRVTHVFDGRKLEISLEAAGGFRSTAQGQADE